MSEDEVDKVLWQESHAADERERHLDRLKELTGLDYGDFERELLKKDQYAAMLISGRAAAQEECDAALEQVKVLRGFIMTYDRVFHMDVDNYECIVCMGVQDDDFDLRCTDDCALPAILAATTPTEETSDGTGK